MGNKRFTTFVVMTFIIIAIVIMKVSANVIDSPIYHYIVNGDYKMWSITVSGYTDEFSDTNFYLVKAESSDTLVVGLIPRSSTSQSSSSFCPKFDSLTHFRYETEGFKPMWVFYAGGKTIGMYNVLVSAKTNVKMIATKKPLAKTSTNGSKYNLLGRKIYMLKNAKNLAVVAAGGLYVTTIIP